jgi:Alginate export
MKACFPFLALFALTAVAAGQAQTPGPSAGQSDSDTAQDSNEKSYFVRTFKFSGSIRERWEATDGPFSVTPADSYVVSQIRLGLLFHPASWLNFFAQAQDVRPLFYQTKPSNAFSDPFDLHQAWVSMGQPEGPGASVQIGRQEMVIGSGHLLASTDDWWVYTDRDFDVANGTYATKYFKAQLVAGSVILVNRDGFSEHRPGDHLYADYNTFPHLIPGASVEPYLIARTSDNVKSKEEVLGNMDTLALGIRVAGKLRGGFDYNFEPLHEFGSYSSDRLDAAGLLTGGGWTMAQSSWKPRFSADYEYASGDDGKKNGTRENFDNMFGYNYPMNSLTGLFDWKNLKDLRAGVEFGPFKKLKFKLNGREFWLANTHDGFYNAYGARIVFNPVATSAHVGESVEMMATAAVTKTTTFGFGVGTLFPGEYLKQSQKDQAFIYPYIYFAQKF